MKKMMMTIIRVIKPAQKVGMGLFVIVKVDI